MTSEGDRDAISVRLAGLILNSIDDLGRYLEA
jgi:hypothetical protein